MIKKVAIAQGFRLCFSDELGGMPYTADEIDSDVQMINVPVEPKSIEVAPTQPMSPEPAKGGRKPKNQTEPVERHQNENPMIFDVLPMITNSNSLDELKMIYNTYPGLQKSDEFISALRQRRLELEAIASMEQESEHESDNDVIQPNLFN